MTGCREPAGGRRCRALRGLPALPLPGDVGEEPGRAGSSACSARRVRPRRALGEDDRTVGGVPGSRRPDADVGAAVPAAAAPRPNSAHPQASSARRRLVTPAASWMTWDEAVEREFSFGHGGPQRLGVVDLPISGRRGHRGSRTSTAAAWCASAGNSRRLAARAWSADGSGGPGSSGERRQHRGCATDKDDATRAPSSVPTSSPTPTGPVRLAARAARRRPRRRRAVRAAPVLAGAGRADRGAPTCCWGRPIILYDYPEMAGEPGRAASTPPRSTRSSPCGC